METPMIRVDAIARVRPKPVIEISSIVEAPTAIRCPSPVFSTIAPAQKTSTPATFRPQLALPAPHYMYGIIKFYSEMEKSAQLEGQICDRETKASLDRLMEIDKQKVEMFRQRAKELESKQSWSVFETVVQYITSSSSIMIGVAICGMTPVAGGLLIAAGGLGLLNRAISDLGGWELLASQFTASWELQAKISEQIDTYCFYISTALSVAGSIGIYHAGAFKLLSFAGRNKALQKSIQIIGFATGCMQAVARVGLAVLIRRSDIINSDLKRYETYSVSARQSIHTNTASLRRIIELSEKIGESIKHAIASSAI
jgi:hypothetical protein